MFSETQSIWTYLSEAEKPIIIYGMGDGAEKILNAFEIYGIKADGFMASDEFVRGHSFRGFEVKKLSDIEKLYSDFIIITAFGTSRPEVLDKLYRLGERYEVYAPDLPVYGESLKLFDEKYAADNFNKIKEVRGLFADEKSTVIFDKLIDYKLSGKIDILKAATTPKQEAQELLKIKNDGSETFVDLGAYTGDTVDEFLRITNMKFEKIFAFEPDTKNFMKLRRRFYNLGSAKFIPINAAAWDSDGEAEFLNKGGRNAVLNSANLSAVKKQTLKTVTTKTISSVCKSDKITLIKIDTEGAEAKALLGAAGVIKGKNRPRLIVSAYHRTEDLLDLPLLIKKLDNRYKIYLRHHEYVPAWDTNLYCI